MTNKMPSFVSFFTEKMPVDLWKRMTVIAKATNKTIDEVHAQCIAAGLEALEPYWLSDAYLSMCARTKGE